MEHGAIFICLISSCLTLIGVQASGFFYLDRKISELYNVIINLVSEVKNGTKDKN